MKIEKITMINLKIRCGWYKESWFKVVNDEGGVFITDTYLDIVDDHY